MMPITEGVEAVNWWMIALAACALWLSFLFGFVAAALMAASRQGEARMTIARLQEEIDFLRAEAVQDIPNTEPDDP